MSPGQKRFSLNKLKRSPTVPTLSTKPEEGEKQLATLRVQVIACRNLLSADANGKSDPCVHFCFIFAFVVFPCVVTAPVLHKPYHDSGALARCRRGMAALATLISGAVDAVASTLSHCAKSLTTSMQLCCGHVPAPAPKDACGVQDARPALGREGRDVRLPALPLGL